MKGQKIIGRGVEGEIERKLRDRKLWEDAWKEKQKENDV